MQHSSKPGGQGRVPRAVGLLVRLGNPVILTLPLPAAGAPGRPASSRCLSLRSAPLPGPPAAPVRPAPEPRQGCCTRVGRYSALQNMLASRFSSLGAAAQCPLQLALFWAGASSHWRTAPLHAAIHARTCTLVGQANPAASSAATIRSSRPRVAKLVPSLLNTSPPVAAADDAGLLA